FYSLRLDCYSFCFFFFFNAPATTYIYTLSHTTLFRSFHDPCYLGRYRGKYAEPRAVIARTTSVMEPRRTRERSFCCGAGGGQMRSEEHTSELQSRGHLVCRLLLEKKKK